MVYSWQRFLVSYRWCRRQAERENRLNMWNGQRWGMMHSTDRCYMYLSYWTVDYNHSHIGCSGVFCVVWRSSGSKLGRQAGMWSNSIVRNTIMALFYFLALPLPKYLSMNAVFVVCAYVCSHVVSQLVRNKRCSFCCCILGGHKQNWMAEVKPYQWLIVCGSLGCLDYVLIIMQWTITDDRC